MDSGGDMSWPSMIHRKLLSLAQAVATDDIIGIEILSKELSTYSRQDGCPTQRVLYYCLIALNLRINNLTLSKPLGTIQEASQQAFLNLAVRTPKLEITYETAFRTIFECIEDSRKIHIIDFASWPHQWVFFLQRMVECIATPPVVRLSIVLTSGDSSILRHNHSVMSAELSQVARDLNIHFEISTVHLLRENIHPGVFRCEDGEDIVVNSSFHLHQFHDSSVLRFNPRDQLLQAIHDLKPKLFSVTDFSVDLNTAFFLSRFRNLVQFYETYFTAIETSLEDRTEALLIEENLLFEQIVNTVAYEGVGRWFRPETVVQMIPRFRNVGFTIYPFSAETFDASQKMMAAYPFFTLRFTDGFAELISNHDGVPIVHHTAWRLMN